MTLYSNSRAIDPVDTRSSWRHPFDAHRGCPKPSVAIEGVLTLGLVSMILGTSSGARPVGTSGFDASNPGEFMVIGAASWVNPGAPSTMAMAMIEPSRVVGTRRSSPLIRLSLRDSHNGKSFGPSEPDENPAPGCHCGSTPNSPSSSHNSRRA
jgi:hypothetical protein